MADLLSWLLVKDKIKSDIDKIFAEYIPSTLKGDEKRRLIFEYVYSNVKFDKELFKRLIKLKNENHLGNRSVLTELYNTIFNHKGTYEGITKYYKLLLDEAGVHSLCTYYDSTDDFGKSSLCLIYQDDSLDEIRFDDIASAIFYKDKDKFFDFDMKKANSYKQGIDNKPFYSSCFFISDNHFYGYSFKKSNAKADFIKHHCLTKTKEENFISKLKVFFNNNKPYSNVIVEDDGSKTYSKRRR